MKAIYQCVVGKEATGPEKSSFNHFKEKWSSINKTQNFQTLSNESDVSKELIRLIKKERQCQDASIRDDYKQCAENTVAISGAISQNDCVLH